MSNTENGMQTLGEQGYYVDEQYPAYVTEKHPDGIRHVYYGPYETRTEAHRALERIGLRTVFPCYRIIEFFEEEKEK